MLLDERELKSIWHEGRKGYLWFCWMQWSLPLLQRKKK